MRDKFRGYYRPRVDEFAKLWEDCIFVLDTNVLLNIYRFGERTRENFLTVLERLKNRLWIPYQVGAEYHDRRPSVVSQQRNAYDAVTKLLRAKFAELDAELRRYQRHPAIEVEKILKSLSSVVEKACATVARQKEQHPDLLYDDDLREQISDLFQGRVGEPDAPEKARERDQEADARISRRIPPGFSDRAKPDEQRRRGDVVLWLQMLDHAKATNKPIIFVTDDGKEDWWLRYEGRTLGPRPELVQEMRSYAHISFYMYSPDRFLEEAAKALQLAPEPEAVEEVRDVQRGDAESAYQTTVETLLGDSVRLGDLLNMQQRAGMLGLRLPGVGRLVDRARTDAFDVYLREAANDEGGPLSELERDVLRAIVSRNLARGYVQPLDEWRRTVRGARQHLQQVLLEASGSGETPQGTSVIAPVTAPADRPED